MLKKFISFTILLSLLSINAPLVFAQGKNYRYVVSITSDREYPNVILVVGNQQFFIGSLKSGDNSKIVVSSIRIIGKPAIKLLSGDASIFKKSIPVAKSINFSSYYAYHFEYEIKENIDKSLLLTDSSGEIAFLNAPYRSGARIYNIKPSLSLTSAGGGDVGISGEAAKKLLKIPAAVRIGAGDKIVKSSFYSADGQASKLSKISAAELDKIYKSEGLNNFKEAMSPPDDPLINKYTNLENENHFTLLVKLEDKKLHLYALTKEGSKLVFRSQQDNFYLVYGVIERKDGSKTLAISASDKPLNSKNLEKIAVGKLLAVEGQEHRLFSPGWLKDKSDSLGGLSIMTLVNLVFAQDEGSDAPSDGGGGQTPPGSPDCPPSAGPGIPPAGEPAPGAPGAAPTKPTKGKGDKDKPEVVGGGSVKIDDRGNVTFEGALGIPLLLHDLTKALLEGLDTTGDPKKGRKLTPEEEEARLKELFEEAQKVRELECAKKALVDRAIKEGGIPIIEYKSPFKKPKKPEKTIKTGDRGGQIEIPSGRIPLGESQDNLRDSILDRQHIFR